MAAKTTSHNELATIRDTVLSVAAAIILAIVLRAFYVEAFVIPTGSMAPRLMGRHWNLQCPQCGWRYPVGAPSPELLASKNKRTWAAAPASAHCPNCGAPHPNQVEFIHGGDRVLVLKYLYNFRQPRRWEVVVFKNPQDNRQNYIKRLVGLPGETIEIVHGDVFVGDSPDGPRTIRPKGVEVQKAVWHPLFNNDYRPSPAWLAEADPPEWQGPSAEETGNADSNAQASPWKQDDAYGRTVEFTGSPSPARLVFNAERRDFLPLYGYNTVLGQGDESIDEDRDICTDLMISAVWTPGEGQTTLRMKTSSFDRQFAAELSTDGRAELFTGGEEAALRSFGPAVELPPFQAGRSYRVELAHVDFCLRLLVNGKLIAEREIHYGKDASEGPLSNHQWMVRRMEETSYNPLPTPQLAISAQGAPCRLSHLNVLRDVYYTRSHLQGKQTDATDPSYDYRRALLEAHRDGRLGPEDERFRAPKDNAWGWGTIGKPIHLARHRKNPDLDEFFVLGDNSPQSLDGRAWVQAAPTLRLYDADGRFQYQLGTVPRYAMIGRALFVYWPAGHRFPGTMDMPGYPIIPNFGKMRLIR